MLRSLGPPCHNHRSMDQEQTTQAPAQTEAAPRTGGRPSAQAQRSNDDERKSYPVGGGKDARGRGRRRKKVSFLTINKIYWIDYKDINLLRRFVNEQGKIVSSRQTGASSKEQRMIATAIRRAREMALMPFVALDSSIGDRGGPRGERRPYRPRTQESSPAPAQAAPAPEAPAE